jgi:adenylate cyclase
LQRTWVAEVVGYRRLAGAGESRTLSLLQGLRSDLIDSAITAQNGRIVRRAGDGLKQCGYDLTRGPGCQTHGDGIIIEFRSVVAAVRCAVEVQTGMVERNAGLPAERRIEFRVRVHLDEVVEEENGNLIGPARFSEQ